MWVPLSRGWDRRAKRVRDLEVSGRRATLVWRRRRFWCGNCGERHLEDPAQFAGGLTRRFARRLVRDARVMSNGAVGCHRIIRLVRAHSGKVAQRRRARPTRVLLVDETSIRRPVLEGRWGGASPATWNNRLTALGWCHRYSATAEPRQTPLTGIERRPLPRDETASIRYEELHKPWTRRDIHVRERPLWRMLYETAARANEILALDKEDLDPATRRATIHSQGRPPPRSRMGVGTARVLSRYLKVRRCGPVFVTHRRPNFVPAIPRPLSRHRTRPALLQQAWAVFKGANSLASTAGRPNIADTTGDLLSTGGRDTREDALSSRLGIAPTQLPGFGSEAHHRSAPRGCSKLVGRRDVGEEVWTDIGCGQTFEGRDRCIRYRYQRLSKAPGVGLSNCP